MTPRPAALAATTTSSATRVLRARAEYTSTPPDRVMRHRGSVADLPPRCDRLSGMCDEALPLTEQEVPVVREGVDFDGVFQHPDERARAHVFGQPLGAPHGGRRIAPDGAEVAFRLAEQSAGAPLGRAVSRPLAELLDQARRKRADEFEHGQRVARAASCDRGLSQAKDA